MLLLAFHIVAIAVIVVMVGAVAYRLGSQNAERRLRRELEQAAEESPLAC